MIRRRAAAALALALLLAGCGGDDLVQGAPVSGSSSRPASSSAASPSSSPASPGPGDAAAFAPYARQVVATALGDPGVLNVCRIAGAASPTSSITLTPPSSALSARCSFELEGADVPAGSSAVVSLSQTEPYPDPKPTTATVGGLPVLRFPAEAATGDCRRALVLKGAGTVTSVLFSGYAKGLAAARMCALGDAVVARFAAAATASADKSPLSTASPSVLSVDACKVVAAAGLGAVPGFTLVRTTPTDFAVGCELQNNANRRFTISSGVLRDVTGTPDGTVETVAGHPLYDDLDGSGSCTVTSRQAKGEIVTMSTTASEQADVATCKAMATALGRYLDVLKLR